MSNINNSTTVDYDLYWSTFFDNLNESISRYGMALIWLIGNIGSAANCLIFSQPNLRKNPCVMYLLASSASQFFTFNFALLTRMLQFGYNVQAVNIYLWFCKTRYYFYYIFVAIPRYYIILASIDRYFASSSDIEWRRLSSPKIAMRLIIGNILFWCLIYIQVLVFYEIQDGDCSFRNGIYGMFFSIYITIDTGILPPALMLIFGLLTLNNIRQVKKKAKRTSVAPAVQPMRGTKMSKKDLQFYKMLISQICLYVLLNIINPCYLLYRTVTENITKSPLHLTIELFINNMTYFLLYISFSLTFFVYTLSSSLFRHEFQQLIRKKRLHRAPSNVALRRTQNQNDTSNTRNHRI